MVIEDILTHRVVMITGKGGVGKSLVSAAMGILSARAGHKTLVVELSGQSQMSNFLGGAPGGYTPVKRGERLYTLSVTMAEGMEEYMTRELRSNRVYKMVFHNEYVSPFIKAVPALEDLIFTGKIMDLERDMLGDKPEWDRIIIDGPPTGQGLSLLKVPKAIMDMTRVGPMYKNAKIIQDLLYDPKRTMVCLATLAEEMPINETLEMYAQLKDLGVPVGPMVVNEVRKRLFGPEEAKALGDVHVSPDAPIDNSARETLEELIDATRHLHRREQMETHQIGRLKRVVDEPILFLPRLLSRHLGPEETRFLADWLSNQAQEAP